MMRKVQQVVLCYVRWATSSLIGALFLAAFVFSTVGLIRSRSTDFRDIFPMANWFVLAMVAGGTKYLMVVARERRWPGSVTPHFLVCGVVTALVTFALPTMAMMMSSKLTWGWLAVTVLQSVVVIWFGLIPSHWMLVPCLLILYAPGIKACHLSELKAGQHEDIAVLMLAGSVILFVGAMVYLANLSEEFRSYHQRLRGNTGASGQSVKMTPEIWKATGSDWFARWSGPWRGTTTKWAKWNKGGVWSRARLWSAGCAHGRAWLGLGILVLTLLVISPISIPEFPKNPESEAFSKDMQLRFRENVFSNISLIWSAMTAIIVVGIMNSDFHWLAYGSLRPVSRRQWVNELGISMLRKIAGYWLIVQGILIVSLLMRMGVAVVPWALVGKTTLISAGLTVLAFGICVWLMWLQSGRKSKMNLLPVVFILLLMVPFRMDVRWSTLSWSGLSQAAALLTVVGVLITRDAYRRWQTAELGMWA
ncbi:MAG: hypothetical protein IT440_06230 [Phycisphaeraceae bacterium]|nr:hypothetical protein [Phycisphaeraceae bacterium]